MKTINIDGFNVGGNKTFIIADIGSNHMQDLSLAKESIDAVAESGANAVKFQSIQTEKLYLNPDLKTKKFIDSLSFLKNGIQNFLIMLKIKILLSFLLLLI